MDEVIDEMKGNTLFAWQAFEFKERDLKTDWYWALGIIAVAGSAAAFIFHDFLFGVFILCAAIIVAVFSRKKPRFIKYEIAENGVVYEGAFYPYASLHSFWLDESDPANKKLLLKSDRYLVPILTLPYNTEDEGDSIFATLADILPDEPLQEPVGHIIMDRLGF